MHKLFVNIRSSLQKAGLINSKHRSRVMTICILVLKNQ